jgi:hypothetical protein
MKGLLHRLAARAAGTTVPVRSDARLPFGGADLGWGETIEIEAAPVPSVAAPASDPAPARKAGRRSAQPDGPEYDASAPMLDHHSTPPPRPALRTDLLPSAPHDAHSAAPATASAAPLPTVDQLNPGLPPRFVEDRPADAIQAPPANAESRYVTAPRPPATQALPPSPRLDTVMRANEEPPLLMPRAAGERALTPSGVPAAAREPAWLNVAAQAAADEPTEVHIHIGRIEVTAVHEAPAQRPKPKAKQAPMSLDAYLAARSKT